MQEKRSFYILFFIMSVVALVVMAITNVILYQVAFEEKSQSLVEIAQSRARLIEAMARYNRRTNRIDWETPMGERGPASLLSERAAADTIGQLKDAHSHYKGLGETGEFVIAGIENENIVFLLRHRHGEQGEPSPVPLYSDIAEPMRRALLVQSGSMVGKDYRGVEVLAAYEPVDVLNFGIVAKVDMSEIRAPFIEGAIKTWLISVFVILLGSILFRKISNTIIDRIRESEKQYRSLVEDINEWVWMTDSNGLLIYSSPVVKQLLDYDNTTLLGTSLPSLMEEQSQISAKQILIGQGDKRIFSNLQTNMKNRQAELIPMEFSATPIFNSEGTFEGYQGVARDISARLESEKIRREYQEKLETQVKERTQDLEDINDELKNFTYIVSHDLRSPLVSIVGFSSEIKEDIQLLQQSDLTIDSGIQTAINTNIPESLVFIDKAAEKMEHLINSILALSRIGRRELTIESVDCNQVVDLNMKAMAYQLENVDITVHELPTVSSDVAALEQIFGNLLDNAVKFLQIDRQGKIEVWSEEKNGYYSFYIKDNGRGIAEADIPHVFELFKRVGDQRVAGDGMGLTYVYTLVRRLGGRIECHSILGEETIFSFTLPVEKTTY
mgnify:CR=1 FL=1